MQTAALYKYSTSDLGGGKMASIIKIVNFSKQLSIKPTTLFFNNSVRTAVMHKDWQPGPFPRTEEQRIKSARKYNLHPDEYVVYPDDHPMGLCQGDYPVLPLIGYDAKDPYYPYDIPADRRNYDETLPEDFEVLGADKLSQMGVREKVTKKEMYLTFFGTMGAAILLFMLGERYKYFQKVTEKQYPSPSSKHYTFESPK